ncbi:MAG: hypothetical protein ACE15E_10100 [Acidobacteriota bacterium]
MAGLKQGRVLVSMGLLTQMTVQERFRPGDVFTAFGELEVGVEVLGPIWVSAGRVLLFANGSLIRETSVPPSSRSQVQKWRGGWKIPKPLHDVYLVGIALGPGVTAPHWPISKPFQPSTPDWDPYILGSTGVLWVDADGDGQFSSARDYAERLLKESGGNQKILERQLQFYDKAVALQVAALMKEQTGAIVLSQRQ